MIYDFYKNPISFVIWQNIMSISPVCYYRAYCLLICLISSFLHIDMLLKLIAFFLKFEVVYNLWCFTEHTFLMLFDKISHLPICHSRADMLNFFIFAYQSVAQAYCLCSIMFAGNYTIKLRFVKQKFSRISWGFQSFLILHISVFCCEEKKMVWWNNQGLTNSFIAIPWNEEMRKSSLDLSQ